MLAAADSNTAAAGAVVARCGQYTAIAVAVVVAGAPGPSYTLGSGYCILEVVL